jgi:hypothetical protein
MRENMTWIDRYNLVDSMGGKSLPYLVSLQNCAQAALVRAVSGEWSALGGSSNTIDVPHGCNRCCPWILSFGLCSAPSTLYILWKRCSSEFRTGVVLRVRILPFYSVSTVYLDDECIFRCTLSEHFQHIQTMLQCLREWKLLSLPHVHGLTTRPTVLGTMSRPSRSGS